MQSDESLDLSKDNNDIKFTFVNIMKARFSERGLRIFMGIMALITILFLIISYLLYPAENSYSIMKDTISFLGSSDEDNNPEGWIFLTIGLVFLSIFLYVISLYQYHRLRLINKFGAFLSLFIYILAAIGLFLTGIFPDDRGDSIIEGLSAGNLHNSVALVAIAGLALGLIFDFMLFVKDRVTLFRGKKLCSVKIWGLPYMIFWVVVGMVAYTQIYWDIVCDTGCWPGDGIYSFPLWEWILFFMIFTVKGMILTSLPNDISLIKIDQAQS
jgi:hypothetical protein